ncbi:MAG: DUF362 domain-containing protein [Acidobacteriota bacterium]
MKTECEISDPRVALVAATEYGEDSMADALTQLGAHLNWHDTERGPFGSVIPRGATVLIKPNLVMHENRAGFGLAPLVTHPALICAAAEAALRAGAGQVLIGDAPLQSCDFDQLLYATGLDSWAAELMARDTRFKGIRDLRRTVCEIQNGVRVAAENLQPEERFVLFDLAGDSLLEPVTDDRSSFRVTCYDPSLMARTHAPGRHQYLVAREAVEADVIINLPKLKTHRKAGVTCALKNLIGINGNKEYLPHHRIGGATHGGDCYRGDSVIKRALEYVADQQNAAETTTAARAWRGVSKPLYQALRLTGQQPDTEGSWSGNDTIWRTCLDLNRILLYGRADASMSRSVQRRVIHIADAVIAGQGDGPLAPEPLELGVLLAANNAPAMDMVGAYLLGYEPARIPIVDRAFGLADWPLAAFAATDVRMSGDWGAGRIDEVLNPSRLIPVTHPIGWRDAARAAADLDRE